MKEKFQMLLRLIYPPRCLACGGLVDSDFGLCGSCWRDTPFIGGLCCDKCGTPLIGETTGRAEHCDECLRHARPWDRGRAALLYRDNGRKLVLALKHGDRQDIARPAAQWMLRSAADLLDKEMLVTPVPLHWSRMLYRRYNQSALLAQAVARYGGLGYCPDLLVRRRRTRLLDGLGRDARFELLDSAIKAHKRRRHHIAGRRVLIVDDVFTSGATLTASASACRAAGACEVCVLALARVAKDA